MAAGLGFKTFTTGEVLTAADVNGYLMQGVLVFASEAARNAAITSPQEGQFAYTKDNNSLWYYTGSAWAASGATGDIEGVTAGTGISGGGTSGTVTITNSMATEIDAKGDLIVGTGADTFARLAVGTNGHTLVADSSVSPTGLKWAAPAASIPANDSATVAGANVQGTSSASYTDLATAGPSVTLTTGTKALVIISAQLRPTGSSNPVIGYAISGATTAAADDNQQLSKNWGNDEYIFASYAVIREGLTAGSNTFTLKYKNEGSGTADFRYRFISVVDMGS